MKLDAIKHQGKSTSRQVGDKYLSVDLLGRQQGDSGRTVQRYIRLTQLIPELLKLVDEQKIAFSPAVEISYLTNQEQLYLLDYIDYNLCTPSLSQAIRLKKMSENGTLTRDQLDTIMDESKQNQTPKLKVSMNKLSGVLPKSLKTDVEKEEYVIKAVIYYEHHQKQIKEKNNYYR